MIASAPGEVGKWVVEQFTRGKESGEPKAVKINVGFCIAGFNFRKLPFSPPKTRINLLARRVHAPEAGADGKHF